MSSEDESSPASKSLASKLVPLVLSTVFALVLAEVIVRIAFHGSVDFDIEMWKYATQVKMPSDDPKVVHEHRPNAHGLLMGVEVTTNAQGLRDVERSVDKPPGTYRIVALGDSLTMGWGVAQDMTFPAQLERMLNGKPPKGFPPNQRFEVLNLGVGNYNTVQEVSRLRNLGLSFHPDLVTLGWFINDAEPTPRPQRGFLIEHSYLAALLASRKNIVAPHTGTWKDYYLGLYRDDQPGWAASKEALGELADLTRSHNVPAIVFLLPELHDLSPSYPFAGVHEQVAKVARDKGLEVVDVFPQFKDYKPETSLWVTPRDAHPNAEAQRRIALGMYEAIEARGSGATGPHATAP